MESNDSSQEERDESVDEAPGAEENTPLSDLPEIQSPSCWSFDSLGSIGDLIEPDLAKRLHKPLRDLLKHGDDAVAEEQDPTLPELIGLLTPTTSTIQELQRSILKLRAELDEQAAQLRTEQASKQEQEKRFKSLRTTLIEFRKKTKLAFLLRRVTPQAEKAIVDHEGVRNSFFSTEEQKAFVISIDIRRSTELMLKARNPTLFAEFMTELCARLEAAIKDEYGVFDKFTGDGVLAFFPEFFSGEDAGYHALMAAQKALAIFTECYRCHRTSFTTVLADAHLAVGIDYGGVHLLQVVGGLTVVGGPVVYACRLSGGKPKTILLNQAAYERISDSYGGLCLIKETELEIKHEGKITCYEVSPTSKPFTPTKPVWAGLSLPPRIE